MSSADTRRAFLLMAFLAGAVLAGSISLLAQWWRDSRGIEMLGDDSTKPVASANKSSAGQMIEQLRGGGFLIYLRHGHRQKWDSVIAFDIHEAAKGEDASQASYRDAVCLSAQGREESAMIGQIFRLARIPVGHVVASPICRARQTAELAFGRIDSLHNALIHTPVVNPMNAADFKSELRLVLGTIPVRSGNNTVISAHENTLVNHRDLFASGATWLQGGMVSETGMYIIRRDPDGSLHLVYKFDSLGDLAAAGITLSAAGPAKH